MAAATGWGYIASGGPALPGYLSPSEGITFASLPTAGYAAWDAVPENGKFQILGVIGILERCEDTMNNLGNLLPWLL